MSKTRIFISQPMRDKTDEEILAEREEIKRFFDKSHWFHTNYGKDYMIIDSFFQGKHDNPLYSLGEAIKLMGTADLVYFASGWDKARGCKIEHECAEAYGIKYIEEIG